MASSCSAPAGTKLTEELEQAIEDELHRVLDPGLKGPRPLEGHGVGTIRSETDLGAAYVEHLAGTSTAAASTACGSWSTAPTGAPRSWPARCSGSWAPRWSPSATTPTARTSTPAAARRTPGRLPGAVVEHGAALGLAFDGDADRLLAVDEPARWSTATRCSPCSPGTSPDRPAGRQHRGGDGDDEPGLPPGHGGTGHPGQGDRRPATATCWPPSTRRALPRWRAVGAHHLPAPGPPPVTAC